MSDSKSKGFLADNEFLIRRLHSLSGLVPVGAYMVVHLVTNASVMNGAASFQGNVNNIHSLGSILPVVEWVFIFIPILFHAIFGFVIIGGGLSNVGSYPLEKNWRYTLQRTTGMLAFLFIMGHVLHLHGWIHTDAWLNAIGSFGGKFRPYNATSSLAWALQNWVVIVLYVIGLTSCVYHFANGVWTMGITWGVWTSPTAQSRAEKLCAGLGTLLLLVGLSALYGAATTDIEEALEIEKAMLKAKVESREIDEHTAEHKSFSKDEEAKLRTTFEKNKDDDSTALLPNDDE